MMIKKRINRISLSGQSLFEVVLALGIISFIIVVLISLTTLSVRNASVAKNKTQANRYAQEAVEWLRGERDAGYDDFYDNVPLFAAGDCPVIDISGVSGTYPCLCLNTLDASTWGDTSCDDNPLLDGKFTRIASFDKSNPSKPNQVDAAVVVSWTDSKGDHAVRLESVLADWRAQP